jgi:histidinol-phosphatase
MVVIAGQEAGGWSDDFALALGLAEAASEVALAFFERGVGSTMKPDGTPVTEADLAVEARLVDVLTRARPDDGIVSEEGGHRAGGHRRWILDPIDGTVNFAAADPNWGTHVALEVNGRLVIGVITRPVAGERWWAIRGGGAYRSQAGSAEKVRLQVSTVEILAEARVTMWPADRGAALDSLRAAALWVEPDPTSLWHLLEGQLDAIVASAGGIWDHAPAVLLTEEAGGQFCDHSGGSSLDAGGGIYSNGRLHQQLRQLLIR